MRTASVRAAVGLAAGISAACLAWPAAQDSPTTAARQLVVVITPDWNTIGGTLQRYERMSGSGPWQPVGAAVPIVVGRSGLAWGRGAVLSS